MSVCHCPGACDCLEAEDIGLLAEWDAWDQAQTPDHLHNRHVGLPLSTGETHQPTAPHLRLVAAQQGTDAGPRPETHTHGRGTRADEHRHARLFRNLHNESSPRDYGPEAA